MARRNSGVPTVDRVLANIVRPDDPDECWGWRGLLNNKGYGKVDGAFGEKTTILAHRVTYEVYIGEIPAGLKVLHRCDNPPCSNPRHLFLGTQAANVADMLMKDRGPRGSRSGTAKLTEASVSIIRQRYAAGGVSYSQLAQEYGVGLMTICWVVRRVTWKHVA